MKYDVFLSYKSEDYKIAMKVHRFLTENGLTVFFSEVTLGNIGESKYSESIDKAIDNSKNMVVVSSNIEYLTQGWVKYEWSAFADNIKSGISNGNLITILTPEVKIKDLPLGLRHRQSFTTKNFTEGVLPYLTNGEVAIAPVKDRSKVKVLTIVLATVGIMLLGIGGHSLRNYNKAVYPEDKPEFIYDFRDSAIISSVLKNEKIDIDTSTVVKYYELALGGSSEAQFEIGSHCYDMAWYDQALYWFELSAKQGNAKAANGIGRCYYNGNGVTKSPRNAYNWFHRSAEGNCVEGMNNMGKCLVEGTGVITPNAKKAMKYYQRAANMKYLPAEYNFGIHLFFGKGIPQDKENGLYWLNKAADEGSASAQNTLGNIYREGLEGTIVDKKKAESWYIKATNNNDKKIALKAQESLKLLHENLAMPN